jgi:hypothetical protein
VKSASFQRLSSVYNTLTVLPSSSTMLATDEAALMMAKGSAIAFGERINVLLALKWS